MLGLFGTLNLASRAMQAQMAGVEVTGQNLANVNTPGYSRQRVQLAASTDINVQGVGNEGTGVNVAGIQRVVNELLNSQVQSQGSAGGYWTALQSALQSAQTGLNDFLTGSSATSTNNSTTANTTDTGLGAQITSFFNAFSALTASSSDSTAQAAVSAASKMATTFNNISAQFATLRGQLNSSISNDVGSANKLLAQIADLNGQIAGGEAGGGNANNLRDERDVALQNLAKLTNFTTSTAANGAVNISVGGQSLVNGINVADTLQTYDAGGGQMLIRTATGGANLSLTGGSLQGTIDARDGELATMSGNLDTLANTLSTQVNTIHNGGFNANGGTGNTFFTGTGAGGLGVNSALTNNPSLLQISNSATNTGDTSLAAQIAALANTVQAGLNGQTFGGSYNSTVAALGTSLKTANDQVASQESVSAMLSNQRDSVSGVNVDEEMTNMMAFQRAYQASAQVVTTVNTMLGDLLAMKNG